jgi:hypothetical protein
MRLERGRNKARATAVRLEAALTRFGVLVADYAAASGAGIIAILPVSAGPDRIRSVSDGRDYPARQEGSGFHAIGQSQRTAQF